MKLNGILDWQNPVRKRAPSMVEVIPHASEAKIRSVRSLVRVKAVNAIPCHNK
jgi:hypothetical protein